MKQSDEVVLAGRPLESAEAISPSGKDAVEYFDIKVLRTWKGSHKVGDTLTFAITNASLRCGALTAKGTPTFSTINFDWKGLRFGVLVLFLRQSKGTEAQLNMGLRLTGGDGLQGAFSVALSVPSDEEMNCRGLDIQHGGLEKCNSFLEASENPVSVPYRRDPLLKKYDGMPIASFLQEVQSVADSLGATPQAESKNRANTQ
jgi:hypothetical protein